MMEEIRAVLPAAPANSLLIRQIPPPLACPERQAAMGSLLAGFYRLAIRLGWTWDAEGGRWLDRNGAPV
jgi:hypothetical protein